MNALENIARYYNHSPRKDIGHETAHQILLHLHELDGMTIYDMAEICSVSTTTISRFVKQLGYKNYAEFIVSLNNIVRNYSYHNQLIPLSVGGLDDTPAYLLDQLAEQISAVRRELATLNLEAFVNLLHESMSVSIFSYVCPQQEFFLQMDLLASGIPTRVVSDPVRQLQVANELEPHDTLIIIMPDISQNEHLREAFQNAHERQAKIILLGTSETMDFIRQADLCYTFAGSKTIIDAFRINIFFCLLILEYRHRYIP